MTAFAKFDVDSEIQKLEAVTPATQQMKSSESSKSSNVQRPNLGVTNSKNKGYRLATSATPATQGVDLKGLRLAEFKALPEHVSEAVAGQKSDRIAWRYAIDGVWRGVFVSSITDCEAVITYLEDLHRNKLSKLVRITPHE